MSPKRHTIYGEPSEENDYRPIEMTDVNVEGEIRGSNITGRRPKHSLYTGNQEISNQKVQIPYPVKKGTLISQFFNFHFLLTFISLLGHLVKMR